MDSRTQYPFQPVRQYRVSVEILTEDGARFFGMHQPHLDSFSDKTGDDTQKRNLSGPGFYMQVLDIGCRYPEIPFHFPDFFQDLRIMVIICDIDGLVFHSKILCCAANIIIMYAKPLRISAKVHRVYAGSHIPDSIKGHTFILSLRHTCGWVKWVSV